LLLAAMVLVVAAAAAPQVPVVERVVDGDTVIVTQVGAVRLIGVDTPETVHPNTPVDAFGKESKRFLEQLVLRQPVRLEFDFQRTDRYGRTLAYLFLADGRFVNAEIVKQGYGHAYTKYPFRYLEDFRRYEREAREAGRGLWAEEGATP
jgi:micrococcal nuclease